MKVTFLGTGTSQGVPVIGCKCEVCLSENIKDKRLRSSVLIQIEGKNFVIDAGPDFRQQMLRENVGKLDAILVTHEHKDHIGGLDDIRAFNYIQQKPIEIYVEKRVADIFRTKEFAYVFAENPYPGIPKMNLIEFDNNDFNVTEVYITPIRGLHHSLPVFGFKIGDFAYITDMNFIPEDELIKLKGLKILVINALRKKKHISHFSLSEALEMIEKVKPEKAYLTHISHAMGKISEIENELPENVFIGYDKLSLEL